MAVLGVFLQSRTDRRPNLSLSQPHPIARVMDFHALLMLCAALCMVFIITSPCVRKDE